VILASALMLSQILLRKNMDLLVGSMQEAAASTVYSEASKSFAKPL